MNVTDAAAIVYTQSQLDSMDAPVCEVCGEAPATVRMAFVAACDDCTANAARAALADDFGHVCANIGRDRSGNLQVCLTPYGVEHHHG